MSGARLDITIEQGKPWIKKFRWATSGLVEIDLQGLKATDFDWPPATEKTGYLIQFVIKNSYSGDPIVVCSNIGDGGIYVDGTYGFKIEIPDYKTADLSGNGFYELKLIYGKVCAKDSLAVSAIDHDYGTVNPKHVAFKAGSAIWGSYPAGTSFYVYGSGSHDGWYEVASLENSSKDMVTTREHVTSDADEGGATLDFYRLAAAAGTTLYLSSFVLLYGSVRVLREVAKLVEI